MELTVYQKDSVRAVAQEAVAIMDHLGRLLLIADQWDEAGTGLRALIAAGTVTQADLDAAFGANAPNVDFLNDVEYWLSTNLIAHLDIDIQRKLNHVRRAAAG